MTIIVTGAAGFIGSNLIRGLNARGERNIIAVDNLSHADKFRNLADGEINDYLDKEEFLGRFAAGEFKKVHAVFHQGACSDTMETDGRYVMQNNYRYSLAVLDACEAQGIPLYYASSAATYGLGPRFVEVPGAEKPLNVYAYSKLLFDQVVRRRLEHSKIQIVGLRYFNVYGPRENHKGRGASVAFHHFGQYARERRVKLFGAWDGWEAGTQLRDFVSVQDVVKVNLFFLDHPISGIYNVGTGRAQTFNDVALSAVNACRVWGGVEPLALTDLLASGELEYIPFPDALKGKYQSYTQADITLLREAGFHDAFLSVEEGVVEYAQWLFDGHHLTL
ncbi:MAG: ADP-glyceromanno-heptose 6-epimerase [Burkholderiaceae bacterium]|jgi:ADP-L-glycero-D-manno-heptose 6-epimerase